ncbi:hypothetical protein PTTG_10327 [Puccinia triticina 1-1 BBBD Race 1]|uniref:Uncharacterized protein n=1 Tax=Puccinia triticina (isolate 1-1 / race 1 (BBBD)) TaxID=630390 RepID=A0A180G0S2_PUCT1|nr:hypothetical protein PTTG_10327 [Puccinia triticina 1-1 BBBD Race 1]
MTATSAGLDWGGRQATDDCAVPGGDNWAEADAQVDPAAPDGYAVYPSHVSDGGGPEGACSWENSGCLRTPKRGLNGSLDIVRPDPSLWVVNFDDG